MVNATLILAIALVLSLIVLVGKVSALRDTTLAALTPQTERLAELSQTVQGLERLARYAPRLISTVCAPSLRACAPPRPICQV